MQSGLYQPTCRLDLNSWRHLVILRHRSKQVSANGGNRRKAMVRCAKIFWYRRFALHLRVPWLTAAGRQGWTYKRQAKQMKPYILVLLIAAIAALADLLGRHEATSGSNRPVPSAFSTIRRIRRSHAERTAP